MPPKEVPKLKMIPTRDESAMVRKLVRFCSHALDVITDNGDDSDEDEEVAGLTVRTKYPQFMQAMRIEAQILQPPRSYAPIWQSQHNPITAIKIQVRAVIAKYYELYPETTGERYKKDIIRMDEFERLKTADDIRTWLNWLKDETLKEHIVGELEAFAPFHEVRRCTI